MFDRTMEDISLVMRRFDMNNLPPRGLPEGYAFRLYRLGDESHWARIETSAGEFAREEDAYPAFERYFGRERETLPHRMLFLLDESGTPIGTSTAWAEEGRGQVHWVSIETRYQGRRLCKPLVAETLYLIAAQGRSEAFLTTQPPSWVAIRVYLACGFVPVITDGDSARGWALVKEKLMQNGCGDWREPVNA